MRKETTTLRKSVLFLSTDYELVRKEVQRLVTKETTCRSSDLICCDGKVLEYGQCLSKSDRKSVV